MDAEQKYTEVEFTNFQVDSEFLYTLDNSLDHMVYR